MIALVRSGVAARNRQASDAYERTLRGLLGAGENYRDAAKMALAAFDDVIRRYGPLRHEVE